MAGQFKKPPPLWKRKEILKLRKRGVSSRKIQKRLNVNDYDVRKYGGKSVLPPKKSAKDWAKVYPDLKSRLLSKDRSVVKTAISTANERDRMKNPEHREKSKKIKKKHRTTDIYKETTEAYKLKAAENQKLFYARNPGLRGYNSAAYRKKVREATPPWVRNNPKYKKQIKDIYKAAKQMKGGPWEVHHRVPIEAAERRKGDIVARGLHVPWNLEIVPKRTNRWLFNILPVINQRASGPANTGGLNENILPIWPEGSSLLSYVPRADPYKDRKKKR